MNHHLIVISFEHLQFMPESLNFILGRFQFTFSLVQVWNRFLLAFFATTLRFLSHHVASFECTSKSSTKKANVLTALHTTIIDRKEASGHQYLVGHSIPLVQNWLNVEAYKKPIPAVFFWFCRNEPWGIITRYYWN